MYEADLGCIRKFVVDLGRDTPKGMSTEYGTVTKFGIREAANE